MSVLKYLLNAFSLPSPSPFPEGCWGKAESKAGLNAIQNLLRVNHVVVTRQKKWGIFLLAFSSSSLLYLTFRHLQDMDLLLGCTADVGLGRQDVVEVLYQGLSQAIAHLGAGHVPGGPRASRPRGLGHGGSLALGRRPVGGAADSRFGGPAGAEGRARLRQEAFSFGRARRGTRARSGGKARQFESPRRVRQRFRRIVQNQCAFQTVRPPIYIFSDAN